MRGIFLLGSGLLFAATLVRTPPPRDPDPMLTVATVQGQLRGARAGTTRVFRGIPYAAPPVGALRWRPPQPAPRWAGVRDAVEYGPVCTQTQEIGKPSAPVIGAEDCLTLNVWSPPAARALPVMVWIHGGFSNWGSSSAIVRGVRLYDGQYLAEHGGVVVVTLNYRLGPLGFLAHPQLSAETPYHGSGNYGYMDVIAALGWVRGNIAAFGGDPRNITIFGESAGGTAVGALMVSPLARGLFQRAIQQSADYVHRSLAEAENYGIQLSRALGCATDDSGCLRARPAAELISAMPRALRSGGEFYKPVVDGFVLNQRVFEAFREGRQQPVPFLTGVTAEESANLLQYYVQDLDSIPSHAAARDALVPYFEQHLQIDRRSAEATARACGVQADPKHTMIACASQPALCANQDLARLAAARQPVYRYVYSHVFHAGPLRRLGAGHGMELAFVFHNFPAGQGFPEADADELALSGRLVRWWAQFARTGDPNEPGAAIVWPRCGETARPGALPYLDIDSSPQVRYASEESCRLWENVQRSPASRAPGRRR